MNIYLAGKISKFDWRHSIVEGLAGINGADSFPVLEKTIFGRYNYVGPYFANLGGHGSTHMPHSHGFAGELEDNHGMQNVFEKFTILLLDVM